MGGSIAVRLMSCMMWFGTMSRNAPALVVVTAALFHADCFGHRDLDVVDVAAVPDRLKNAVGEAECQNILDGLFAKVVIDAVDLLLVRHLQQLLVQRPGGIKVVTKRLFDDDAPPVLRFSSSNPAPARFSAMAPKNSGAVAI